MKILESGVLALVFLALVVNYFQLSAGSTLTSLALAIAAVFYLFFGFALFNRIDLSGIFQASAYEDSNALTIAGGALLGLSFALIFTGALFKLQLRTGAGPLLLAGILLAAFVFGTSLFARSETVKWFHQNIRQRVIGMIGIGAILYWFM